MSDTTLLCLRAVVHPWLCDAMGHLTTRHYLGMFDDASYHLLHDAFGYVSGKPEWEGLGWADVRQVIEYKNELRVGDTIEVRGQLVRLGTKSISTSYEMIERYSGTIAATLECTTAFFDTKARSACPLTDAMRARAAPFLK